jgi:hypothetical protein
MQKQFCRLALYLVAAIALQAQITTTTISGIVTDATGGGIPNAQVTVSNTGTGLTRAVTTNYSGAYRVDLLPAGNYDIEVTAAGFKKSRQTGITLEINRTARVDAQLLVGSVNEEVTVTADAPLVNTSNPQIGRTTGNAEINNLPIVGRNVYTLLNLTPGVDSNVNSIVLGYPQQVTMINGGVDGGAGSVNYFLDGGTNMTGLRNTGNIAPNPDAVEEFRVLTNSYSAEFGRFASGVINIITKSGTNELHGSVYEFLRNTDFNANTWGNAGATPPLHRNQYGGTVGGAIVPNRTFFFGSFSGLRQITSNFFTGAIVPDMNERNGNFAELLNGKSPIQLVDPSAGKTPFPGDQIPLTRMDKTALNILNQSIPLPNSPGNGWQGITPSPYNTTEYLVKVDHSLSDRDRVTLSYFETSGLNTIPGSSASGALPWSTQNFDWRQQNANASDTFTLTPDLVNQLWLSYTRNFGGRLSTPQQSLASFGSSYAIEGTPSLPQIAVTSYFTLGQAISGPVAGTNFYSIRDVMSWTRGKHTFKFGGELSLDKDIQQTLLNNYGVFAFNGKKTGDNDADYFLGLPNTMNQDTPVEALANFFTGALFAQDDFKILPRFTLNLGVRWDVQQAPTDPQNREATFVQGAQSQVLATAPAGLLVVGDPGVGRGVVNTELGHVTPRIGFAWDVFGDGKTSIRGGGGIFYGSVSGNEWNTMSNYQPFAVREQFSNVQSLTNPYGNLPGGVSPFPIYYNPKDPSFIYPATVYGFSKNFQWPYTYQFNMTVERQITKDLVVGAGYVGSLGRRLPFAVDLNYPSYAPGATTGNVNNRRPIDTGVLSNIYSVESVGNTSYNGLQVTVEKRFARHFAAKGFYTYSKALEDMTLENNTVIGGVEDFHNIGLDRGRSDYDRRHSSVSSIIWDISYMHDGNPILRNIVNGWQVSAIVTLQSGLPFSVLTGADTNLDGNSNDRANLVGDPFLDPHRSRSAVTAEWFNTAAFALPASGTDGNSARDLMTGPGNKNVDLGLFRNFRIHERWVLQARGEFTNGFNLVNLSNPNATYSTAVNNNFGKILTAATMRQVQLGLRLSF